jgi:hypothetical protein
MEPFSKKIKLKSFEDFVESVFSLIDKTEIYLDQYYPDALFLVDEYENKEVIYADDICEEKDIEIYDVIKKEFPAYIKESETKWYACSCLLEDDNGYEILIVIFGNKHATGINYAEVYEEGNYQVLGEWNEASAEDPAFSPVIAPIRRSIVNQG